MDILNTLDIAILVILLFYTLAGFARGFLNSLIQIFGTLVSLAIAIWFARPVASFLNTVVNATERFAVRIENALVSIDSFFDYKVGETLPAFPEGESITGAELESAVGGADGISGILERFLSVFIDPEATIESGTHIGSWFGEILGAAATLVTATLIIFIGIKVAVAILGKIFDAVSSSKAIGGLDRLLGILFGAAKGGLYISIGFAFLSLVVVLPGGESILNNLIAGSTIGQSWYMFVHEQITELLDVIDFNEIIHNAYTGG